MVLGTAAGIAAWPFHRQLRSVLMGTSIGLYLGIAVGIYYINNRNDPQNPLAAGSLGGTPEIGSDLSSLSYQPRTPYDVQRSEPQFSKLRRARSTES